MYIKHGQYCIPLEVAIKGNNDLILPFLKKRKKERDWGNPLLLVYAVVIHYVVVIKVENPSVNPSSMY